MVSDELLKTLAEDGCQSNGPPVIQACDIIFLNLWGIVKRKIRYARPNNAEELKATIRTTWALMLILFMFILFSWPRFLKILSLYWS